MNRSKYRIDDEGRECTKCNKYKSWSEFHKSKAYSTGRNSVCIQCVGENWRKARKAKDPNYQPRPYTDENGRECRRCGQYKPWSAFGLRTSKQYINGRFFTCKECLNIYTLRRRQENGVKPKIIYRIDDNGRECTKCNVYRPWDEFHKNKAHPFQKAPICKQCARKKHLEWKIKKGLNVSPEYRIDDKGRECTQCNKYKSWSEFYGRKRKNPACKKCINVSALQKREQRSGYQKRVRIDDEGRECTKCNKYKPWSEFHKNKKGARGHMPACKICLNTARNKTRWLSGYSTPQISYRIDNEGRECTKCNKYKPWSKFGKSKQNVKGHNPVCKVCQAALYREKRKQAGKKIRARIDNHGRECEGKCGEYKPWSQFNKGKCANNRHAICKTCLAQKRKEDPMERVHANISTGIRRSLSEIGQSKNGRKWERLVGYTCAELMAHLEALFLPGMTWDNYGLHGWHIDHIKPKKAFNITGVDCDEFKKCWALENLQPLWQADNIRKHARLDWKPSAQAAG